MMINVHSYESMGTFDGPGLRLVVFLQGCNFRCLYCANPDTIAGKGGTPTPPEEIVRMAMSQRPFFGKRGGITFSGGEPTFQAKALVPLVRELKEKGIHVCLDSNGGLWNEDVEELFTRSATAEAPNIFSTLMTPIPRISSKPFVIAGACP